MQNMDALLFIFQYKTIVYNQTIREQLNMMEVDKMKNSNNDTKDPYDIDIQSCSAMDCTGLIPSLPQSEAEIEAYKDLYPFIAETGDKNRCE